MFEILYALFFALFVGFDEDAPDADEGIVGPTHS